MTEAPKRIWMDADEALYYGEEYKRDYHIKYIRADTFHACMEAGCSLHHHLFELLKNWGAHDKEMFDDAQLALDAWNRFLDGD